MILIGIACTTLAVCASRIIHNNISPVSKTNSPMRFIVRDTEPIVAYGSYYGSGTQALTSGNYELAEKDFRASIAANDGTSFAAEYGLAETLARENKLEQAVECYRKVQTPIFDRGDENLWLVGTLKLARLLWLTHRTAKAIQEYDYYRANRLDNHLQEYPTYPYDGPPYLLDFTVINPTDSSFLPAVDTALGVEEDRQGYYSFNGAQDAVTTLQTAVVEAPNSALCHYYLATSLHIVGRVDDAKNEMNNALNMSDDVVKDYARKKLSNW